MNVTRTILVVDDNEVNRGLARDVLCFKGYVVHEAGNAQEALALIAEHRPDMVILDIQLPRVSGLDILADIRRSPDLTIARTKVIAATALARPDDRERCLGAGCDAYLSRPFTFKTLTDLVAAMLGPADPQPSR